MTLRESRRTCVGCGRVTHPGELIRLTAAPDGTIRIGRQESGRGAWLCADSAAACFETAIRRKRLPRALRQTFDADDIESVRARLM